MWSGGCVVEGGVWLRCAYRMDGCGRGEQACASPAASPHTVRQFAARSWSAATLQRQASTPTELRLLPRCTPKRTPPAP